MRKIISFYTLEGFKIVLKFNDGKEKQFDLKHYLHLPVFSPLIHNQRFSKIVNHGYFIEWEGLEIDLSADTLWHEGQSI